MHIIVGLGNPGAQYQYTRHNAGFWCIEELARRHGIRLNDRRQLAVLGQGRIEGRDVVLAMPRTYVNLSGEAAAYLRDRYRVKPADFLVLYDDMDFPPGVVRLRPKGSAGGHNGMKSIIASLQTQDFPRVRIGVGKPPAGMNSIPYVLGRPDDEERRLLEAAVLRACDAVEAVLATGLEAAMGRFNQDSNTGEP